MDVSFVAYPETVYSRKYHYAVYMVGKTPLTLRIIKPAMIDAKTEANGKLRVVNLIDNSG